MTSLISKAIPELKNNENCIIEDTSGKTAEAILEMMNNPQLREKLSLRGYETVKQNYSWNKKLEGYESLPSINGGGQK